MKSCNACNIDFNAKTIKEIYCQTCRDNGEARKATLHKYNTSFKNKNNQKRWYYSNIQKTKSVKNKYNRSRKGKESKQKYYLKNKKDIIKKNLTLYKEQMKYRKKSRYIFTKNNSILQCFVCLTKKNIHIHHKNKDIKDNSFDNLIALCSYHHGIEHEKINLIKSQNKQ